MAKKRYPSSKKPLERRIQAYLPPRYHKLFIAEQIMRDRKESEHACRIIEKHYDSLPPADIRMLQELYEKQNPKGRE